VERIQDWEWYGLSGHCIIGRWCRFHMLTNVGNYLVSTIGQYVHPTHSNGSEKSDAEWCAAHPNGDELGPGRTYETFVFPHDGSRCSNDKCGCGQVVPSSWTEVDSLPANDPGTARKNHMELCRKWARKGKHSEKGE
jgi:hypothetical protein